MCRLQVQRRADRQTVWVCGCPTYPPCSLFSVSRIQFPDFPLAGDEQTEIAGPKWTAAALLPPRWRTSSRTRWPMLRTRGRRTWTQMTTTPPQNREVQRHRTAGPSCYLKPTPSAFRPFVRLHVPCACFPPTLPASDGLQQPPSGWRLTAARRSLLCDSQGPPGHSAGTAGRSPS